jgi:hypothetical protein
MFKKMHGNVNSDYDPKYIIQIYEGKSELKEFTKDTIQYDQMVEISNIEKPLNGITYYKLAELRDMCGRLDIDINQTDKKQSLYNKLQNYVIKIF